jgi:hypothetical protein
MGADEYHVHRQHDQYIKKDHLDVWKPVGESDFPTIQIDQCDGVSAAVSYRPEEAIALAQAILTAAGIAFTIPPHG